MVTLPLSDVVPVLAFWIKEAAATVLLKVVVPVLVSESAPIAPLAPLPMAPVKPMLPSVVVMIKPWCALALVSTVELNDTALLLALLPPVVSSVMLPPRVTALP